MTSTSPPTKRLDPSLSQRDPLELPSRGAPIEDLNWALEAALRQWIRTAIEQLGGREMAQRVALRLGIEGRRPKRATRDDIALGLVNCRPDDVLRVVNAILQDPPRMFNQGSPFPGGELVKILEDANSAYAVEGVQDDSFDSLFGSMRLVRRTDPVHRSTLDQAKGDATPEARRHLDEAWKAAYAFEPDPDRAYASAVKAVEDVAIPIMCPQAKNPTLGHVLTVLTGARTATTTTWELRLPDQDGVPASAEVVESMVKLLWHGQRSRHAGGASSRANTREEAQAAVQLAVLLVGWFSTGVVAKVS